MKIKKYLIKKWDDIVYYFAVNSVKRKFDRTPGLSYLFELHLRSWNERHPISDSLKAATESFFKEWDKN